ncbi:MAG: tetratricopeptide repeat protein, partial [Acidobacteria bacterium]|nr:tetratricopeptide repeat protein [Acidobacteriota bacterium]
DPGGTVKSTKRGTFIFPQLELFEAGYILTVESEEWYIRKYHIRTRRGTKEIFQDDEGSLNPKAQDKLPIVRHRGANTTISLVVAKIAEYVPPAAAPGAPGGAAGQPKRELTLVEKADEAAALGDYNAAIELLNQALAEKPNDADVMWSKATYMAKSGDAQGAIREGYRVVQVAPERTNVRLQMAAWMEERGQLAAAIPLLEKERELQPSSAPVAKGLFEAYGEAGQAENAAKEVDRWLTIAPDDPEALLAKADLLSGKGDFAGAEEIFRKLAAADPKNADRMYYNAGISIMNKHGVTNEDRKRAITAFEKSVETNPKYAKAWNQLGLAYLGLGEYPKAREAFKKFLELDSSSADAVAAKDLLKALPAR